jgi:glycosidase
MLPYYPDQLDAHFAFEAADAIVTAVRTGSARNLFAPYMRLQRELPADRWSPFLRNHDQTRTMTELGGDVAQAKLAATLLLTLPGLPFIYYGEEIGMTGNKPDPRLRTPMHWRRAPAAGFTTGFPWEPLQPDSMTANVEALDGDPTSLLNIHRRLIHLRTLNPALAAGELVPLTASSDAVAAYLRRDGDMVVLVVANLGAAAVSDVSISSGERVLPAGRYTIRPTGTPLLVGSHGRIQNYVPLQSLGGREILVFEVTRR